MLELASQAPLAFAAGLLSVLSPCVMPLMPAYLSLVSGLSVEEMQDLDGTDEGLRRRVLRACFGFVAGFTVVFMAMGVGAVAVGHVVRTWRAEVFGIEFGAAHIAGALIVLFGLHMMGALPIRALYRDTRFQLGGGERSVLSTFLVGAGFALGWSPCIGPILSTVLTLAAARETMWQGTLLLGVYSLGLAIPFMLAGWSIEFFFRAFTRLKHHFRKLEIASGAMLIGVGMLLLTDQLTRLNRSFTFLNEWVVALEKALL